MNDWMHELIVSYKRLACCLLLCPFKYPLPTDCPHHLLATQCCTFVVWVWVFVFLLFKDRRVVFHKCWLIKYWHKGFSCCCCSPFFVFRTYCCKMFSVLFCLFPVFFNLFAAVCAPLCCLSLLLLWLSGQTEKSYRIFHIVSNNGIFLKLFEAFYNLYVVFRICFL